MGTRNLTIVQLDGEYKIAQYGQWDGYPEGGGLEALDFARNLTNDGFRERFESNLRKSRFLTQEELEEIDEKINRGEIADWQRAYPQLSRDMGRDILNYVYEQDNGTVLSNSIDFAADSLFCEWAWVIDLDKNMFEAYVGFNDSKPLTENDRFSFLKEIDRSEYGYTYHQITKAAEWHLYDLPSKEEFLEAFKEDEDDEFSEEEQEG